MRPILLLILTISVTLLGTSTWAETPKEKWEGYKPVAEAGLPPKVKEFAENSIFLIQSVEILPGSKVEILDFEKDKDDPRLRIKTTDRKSLRTDLTALQVETCRKQKLKRCPIATKVSRGTLFHNNGKFYSCRHGFHNWLAIAASENNKSVAEISPPMILSRPANGKSGKVVYNSAYSDEPMMGLDFINESPSLNDQFYDVTSSSSANNKNIRYSDYVEMSLPKVLSTSSIPIGGLETAATNEVVYSIGYPGKTNYSSLGDNNATQLQLYATYGYVKGFYGERNLFESSNFGSAGLSGSPIVTDSGKLVGMTCSTFDMAKSNTVPGEVSAAFFPIDSQKMSVLWNSLNKTQEVAQEDSTVTLN